MLIKVTERIVVISAGLDPPQHINSLFASDDFVPLLSVLQLEYLPTYLLLNCIPMLPYLPRVVYKI